jgi:hypothetical protein
MTRTTLAAIALTATLATPALAGTYGHTDTPSWMEPPVGFSGPSLDLTDLDLDHPHRNSGTESPKNCIFYRLSPRLGLLFPTINFCEPQTPPPVVVNPKPPVDVMPPPAPIPLPAAGLMLVAALGGLAAVRRGR